MRIAITGLISALALSNKVFSAPAPSSSLVTRDDSLAVSVIPSTIDTLVSSVDPDITAINSAIGSDTSVAVVPSVESSLDNIVSAFNLAIGAIPKNSGANLDSTVPQNELVIASVNDTLSTLISEIKTTVENIASTIEQDAISIIKPHVLAALLPIQQLCLDIAEAVGFRIGDTSNVVGFVAAYLYLEIGELEGEWPDGF